MCMTDNKNIRQTVFNQAIERMKNAGLPIDINPDTKNALIDLQGKAGTYRLVLKAVPSPTYPRSLHIQSILTKSSLDALHIDHNTLLKWMNAKNADIIFGRYYFLDDNQAFVFEVALPVFEDHCDWAVFDEFLRLAMYSVEDSLAQLQAVAKG